MKFDNYSLIRKSETADLRSFVALRYILRKHWAFLENWFQQEEQPE